MSDSHGLQTDLHWSSDFTGSRTSIWEISPSGKSLMDLYAIEFSLNKSSLNCNNVDRGSSIVRLREYITSGGTPGLLRFKLIPVACIPLLRYQFYSFNINYLIYKVQCIVLKITYVLRITRTY